MTKISTKVSYPASVVKVIDEYTIVINRGSEHGVSKGDRFLVYCIDPEELTDPETGESLGKLEVVRGTGSAFHVQSKVTTVKSNRSISRSRIIKRVGNPAIASLLGKFASEQETIEEPEKEVLPFDEVEVKDQVKPI